MHANKPVPRSRRIIQATDPFIYLPRRVSFFDGRWCVFLYILTGARPFIAVSEIKALHAQSALKNASKSLAVYSLKLKTFFFS